MQQDHGTLALRNHSCNGWQGGLSGAAGRPQPDIQRARLAMLKAVPARLQVRRHHARNAGLAAAGVQPPPHHHAQAQAARAAGANGSARCAALACRKRRCGARLRQQAAQQLQSAVDCGCGLLGMQAVQVKLQQAAGRRAGGEGREGTTGRQ